MLWEVPKENISEANCCVSLVFLHWTMFAFQNPCSTEVINHLVALHMSAAAQLTSCLTSQADFSKHCTQERWKGAQTQWQEKICFCVGKSNYFSLNQMPAQWSHPKIQYIVLLLVFSMGVCALIVLSRIPVSSSVYCTISMGSAFVLS